MIHPRKWNNTNLLANVNTRELETFLAGQGLVVRGMGYDNSKGSFFKVTSPNDPSLIVGLSFAEVAFAFLASCRTADLN